MTVENEINTYTSNVEPCDKILFIRNVWNRDNMIELQMGEEKVIVSAYKLKKAIENSTSNKD